MFLGYENESHMREMNKDIADFLISTSNKDMVNVSTRGKKCVSFDGNQYEYMDSPPDEGEDIAVFTAEINGFKFRW